LAIADAWLAAYAKHSGGQDGGSRSRVGFFASGCTAAEPIFDEDGGSPALRALALARNAGFSSGAIFFHAIG
jgi:hypothetical protein